MENIFQALINLNGLFNNFKNIFALFREIFLKRKQMLKYHQYICILDGKIIFLKIIKRHRFLHKREYKQITNQR